MTDVFSVDSEQNYGTQRDGMHSLDSSTKRQNAGSISWGAVIGIFPETKHLIFGPLIGFIAKV